jgi:hypothetical protein
MHPLRLRERVPSCRAIGVGSLAGHSLRFHKRGVDGSGKCNALQTGRPSDAVAGVVYEIARRERRELDEAESLGSGYAIQTVDVVSNGGVRQAFTYLADPGYIDAALHPYAWYKGFVVAGARYHRLPPRYVATLESVNAVADPNAARADANLRILSKLVGRCTP